MEIDKEDFAAFVITPEGSRIVLNPAIDGAHNRCNIRLNALLLEYAPAFQDIADKLKEIHDDVISPSDPIGTRDEPEIINDYLRELEMASFSTVLGAREEHANRARLLRDMMMAAEIKFPQSRDCVSRNFSSGSLIPGSSVPRPTVTQAPAKSNSPKFSLLPETDQKEPFTFQDEYV